MNKIIFVCIMGVIFLSGCDFKNNMELNKESQDVVDDAEQVSGIQIDKYIVTENVLQNSDTEQEIANFSIYTKDGTFIKKIKVPDDTIALTADSKKVFGNKIYYLSGTENKTVISELDPFTEKQRRLLFTEEVNTNKGNVLFAIIAWAVSPDNKKVAWIDAEGDLHVSNIDNTKYKQYKKGEIEGEIGNARVSFSNDSSTLYVWRQGESMLSMIDMQTEEMTPLVTNENGEYLVSPNEDFLVYSNFETPLAIKNLVTDEEVELGTPDENGILSFIGFSANESKFYFSSEILQEDTKYYVVNSDGTNLVKIDDERLVGVNNMNMDMRSDAIAQCVDGTCLINLTNKLQESQIISDEWFLGILGVAENKIKNPIVGIIALDGTPADEKHKSKQLIGCDDKIIEMKLEGIFTSDEILNKLFEFRDYDNEFGYYNVFEHSQKLFAESVIIDQNGLATVKLSGDLLISGMCDVPRVTAQIETTLRQIEGVEGVKIYINGENVDDFLSEKE